MIKRIACIGFCLFTYFLSAQTVSTLVSKPGAIFEAIDWASDNSIYSMDLNTNTVYKIDLSGQLTSLGTFNGSLGAEVDSENNFYFSEHNTGKIIKITPSGQSSTLVSGFSGPTGILIDETNQILYVANYSSNSIATVDLTQSVLTPKTLTQGGPIKGPDGLAFAENGDIISANFNNNIINRITPDGQISQFAQIADSPNSGYIVKHNDRYIITGANGHNMYEISLDGQVKKLAGNSIAGYQDGILSSSLYELPNGVALSPTGDSLLIAESSDQGRIRLVTGLNLLNTTLTPEISSLEISPNPAGDFINIKFDNTNSEAVKISLVSLDGMMVDTIFEGVGNNSSFNKSFQLKDHITPNTYILNIKVGKKQSSKKIVIK